ncbi:MAG: hypothetical protein RIC81_03055 [Microcella pacifica]|uniref:hypothetical protein n=1 Tax=Microcella pacifica TaxID=2591847 RepID=UPI003315C6ED
MTRLLFPTTTSGIPMVRRIRPGEAQVALIFGSGTSQSAVRSAGVPHLVEHAVMRGVAVPAHEHNAVTERDAMTFYASGAPGQVAEFVRAVADSVSRIASDELSDLHRDVAAIDAEVGAAVFPVAGPLARRFGYRGLGIAEFGAPTLDRVTPEEVVSWVREHLHIGNASLVVIGPDVPELEFDVLVPKAPDGWARAKPATASLLTTRTWTWSESAPLAVTFDIVGDWPVASLVGHYCEEAVLADLRHERSLVYSVLGDYITHGRYHRSLVLFTDPPPSKSTPAVSALVELIDRLSGGRVDPSLLARTRERMLAELFSESGWDAHAGAAGVALAWREERTGPVEAERIVAAITEEEIVAALQPAAEGLLVTLNAASGGLDDSTAASVGLSHPEIPNAPWPQRSAWDWGRRLTSGRTLTAKGRRGSPSAGATLTLDDGQLLLSDSDSAWAIDLSSVALLLHSSTGFEITLEDSWSLDVTYTAWKGAEPLGRAIRERVPADRVVHVESRLGLPVSP